MCCCALVEIRKQLVGVGSLPSNTSWVLGLNLTASDFTHKSPLVILECFLFPSFICRRPLEVSLSITFIEVTEDPALGVRAVPG